ncbi:MAG: hypothetical protein VX899_24980 [Myxococcota bacterium]|nr:hypothetical protein [Myxococcota bacterium]
MTTTLAVLIAAAVAWIIAHFVADWIQERFFVTTGSEYMLLGVLLGPVPVFATLIGTDNSFILISQDTLRQLDPLMSLAVGWVGLTYGASLSPTRLVARGRGALTLSLVATVVTGLVVFGASYFLFGLAWHGELSQAERLGGASGLGMAAAVSSPTVLRAIKVKFEAQGPTTKLLGQTGRLEEFIGILGFGVIFCVFHEDSSSLGREITPFEWFGISVGLGLVLGALFRFFLKDEDDRDKQFLSLVGIIVFASGAAHFLDLSPLLVNAVMGTAMMAGVNDDASERILAILERSRRPMYMVMLIFAGAMWLPIPAMGWAFVAAYIVVRLAARMLSGWVSSVFLPGEIRRDVGRGLLPQGEVAVAMALNLTLVFGGRPVMPWVFSAILVSVLLNEFWSARLLRGLLIDAGDIRHSALQEPELEES